MRATILVRPKSGILDPQGAAVETALEHLGFSVSGARVGKVVDLEVASDDATEARAQVEKMCGAAPGKSIDGVVRDRATWLARSRASAS